MQAPVHTTNLFSEPYEVSVSLYSPATTVGEQIRQSLLMLVDFKYSFIPVPTSKCYKVAYAT